MSTVGLKWEKYEGQFINGYRHGTGMLYFTSGERYFGGVENDKINGAGTFKNKNGSTITGAWKNNILEI
jgi:hypothetical protein